MTPFDDVPTATPAAPSPPTVDLGRVKRMFDDARLTCQDARVESDLDRDYYDGHQLSDKEIAVLRKRKQPTIVINWVREGINGILGVVEQGKTDPRAYMRNPPDMRAPPVQAGQAQVKPQTLDAGDVATMTLRYISDVSGFQQIEMDVLENGLIEGSGAAIFENVDGEIIATQIRWEEFFYDPRSRRNDFKDAKYMGVAKWMYADELAAAFPEIAGITDFATSGQGLGAYDQTWEDRPNYTTPWVDSKQRRLMVVDMYYQDGSGDWSRCVFYAGGVLEDGPSVYLDEKTNRPTNPIEAWSAYVDRQNRRYGAVRDMRGPQDEVNMRRSKALHEINTRQIQATSIDVPPVDVNTARQEAARPDGVIPVGYQIVPRNDVVANNLSLLQEAKGELARLSPNPAVLGRGSDTASGRAQQVRQQAGITTLARVLGRFYDWKLRCYKRMWAEARQFWPDPKWVRVTNDDGAPQYIMINEPPTEAEQLQALMTGQPLEPKNDIAKMDVDIVVDNVPDTATLQQEIYADLVQLAQAYGPDKVPFEFIIEMSPLPKKRELVQKLDQLRAEAAQQNQAAGQVQAAMATAKIAETESKAALNTANAKKAEVQATTQALDGAMKASQGPPAAEEEETGETGFQ